jgi:hypothetical protein
MPPEITSVTPAPTTPAPSLGPASLLPELDLEGSIAGVPTKYLAYGALGLVAWRMLKGR